jgi:hypothetical protein
VDLTRSAVEEDIMHPYITQNLMDTRVADRHRAAAASRLARTTRRAARRARLQGVAGRPVAQPAREAVPAAPPACEALPAADPALTH